MSSNIIIYIVFLLFGFILHSAGMRTVSSLNKRPNASESARLRIIPRAGHQMMIDNPDGFHAAVQQALEDD